VSWTVREVGAARGEPLVFHGTKGSLAISRRGFKVVPDVWKADSENETPAMSAVEEPGAELKVLDAAHVRNFLDCVKSRGRPVADVEEGHLTATLGHLGNIATRLGRSLRWDSAAERCVGDAEADRRLHYDYRPPWTL
jgi:predicted dehydrogenase